VVPFPLTEAERDGGAQRRRRRRIVRRIPDATRQPAGGHGSTIASAAVAGAAGNGPAWPVSNDKIGFEYKLKRFLEGCRMPAARAHVYWSGTFDDRERRSLVQQALPRRSIPY
jgi:hypothetical protein